MTMVYKWKDSRAASVPAQMVGEEIERLRSNMGMVLPMNLVDAARPQTSRLHPAFEWNDKVAGERYRQEQAKLMIRMLVIEVPRQDDVPVEVRAFVSINPDREEEDTKPAYTSLDNAMSDARMRAQVVARAYAELQGWHKRYSVYSELAEVATEIEAKITTYARARQLDRV